jgi:Putative DNA-binding domain
MLTLREYQRAVATALMSGETEPAAILIDGDCPPADRLRIHRNTMLTALANALALTYPAVAALVGAAFFAQAARIFIQASPPRAALLSLYGDGFGDFLERYEPAQALPYLPDVARLEWAVECAARGPLEGEAPFRADIDLGGTRLALVPSLTLLRTGYPAEPIWRAAVEGDSDALGRIDPRPNSSSLAVWRVTDGAEVLPLGAGAAGFLQDLLAGGDAESAVNAAAAADPDSDPIAAITREILPAAFARLTPT